MTFQIKRSAKKIKYTVFQKAHPHYSNTFSAISKINSSESSRNLIIFFIKNAFSQIILQTK